jgi:hypothetical protein
MASSSDSVKTRYQTRSLVANPATARAPISFSQTWDRMNRMSRKNPARPTTSPR